MTRHNKVIFGQDGIRNLSCHIRNGHPYSADNTVKWLYEILITAYDLKSNVKKSVVYPGVDKECLPLF